MRLARLVGLVLTALCVTCAGNLSGAASQGAREALDADTAVLAWTAFECSQYARMAGEPEQEAARLFRLGYENGKRFAESARNTELSEELRSKMPVGVLRVMNGPTTDFILGRIFEYRDTRSLLPRREGRQVRHVAVGHMAPRPGSAKDLRRHRIQDKKLRPARVATQALIHYPT